MENSAGQSLYNLLVTKDFEPEILDSSGKAVTDPNDAELFSFDWKTANKNYGTVVVLLGQDNELELYYGDNLAQTMESGDRDEWYDFLTQMKQFAVRNLLTFELNNINRLKYTMQGMAAIKEGLFEGYYGKKNISYSDQPKRTRLMIKHNRDLGEGEARYRAIESLFVETSEGERFKLGFKNLTGGRAMARHVAEGGTPYDAFGQHITQIMNEINTLGRFIRSTAKKEFGQDAQRMLEAAVRHYQDLKAKAKQMISQRGYTEARQSFDPAQIRDSELAVEEIRNMFVEQHVDSRIEEALPLLARLAAAGIGAADREDTMKEIQEFENWTMGVSEGTWARPDTPESVTKLKEIMSKPLPLGPDATNATEILYDVIGDDELFDRLADAANQDPAADARPFVQDRLKELGIDINFDSVSAQPDMAEDLDVDGVMMTRPSNMSSESIERDFSRLVELARS